MQVSRFPSLPPMADGTAVLVGDFDGVHAAQRALLREPLGRGAPVVAVHHPKTVRHDRLSRLGRLARRLEVAGADAAVVVSPVVARDDVLRRLGDAIDASQVVSIDGLDPTTETIRGAVRSGDVVQARGLLGRDPEVVGRVTGGDRRGRSIGFPTANLRLGPLVEPKHGVYAVRARLDGETEWIDGVANLGVRPTFGGKPVVLEAFLFDFERDIYERRLRVRLIALLREEKRFDGIDALKAQIARDCQAARDRLADAGPTEIESLPE